jgi:hypothetical protein
VSKLLPGTFATGEGGTRFHAADPPPLEKVPGAFETSSFLQRPVSKPAAPERHQGMRPFLSSTFRPPPVRPAPSPIGERWTAVAESVWSRRLDALGAIVPSPIPRPGGIRHDR